VSFVYTNAALPALELGKPLPLPSVSLLSFIEEMVPSMGSELNYIAKKFPYTEPMQSKNTFFIRWTAFNRTLRASLALQRNFAFTIDSDALTNDVVDGYALGLTESIVAMNNPLDQELAILEALNRGLNELTKEHMYARENLIAYAIRVVLVERFEAYNHVAGWKQFNGIQTDLVGLKDRSLAGKIEKEGLFRSPSDQEQT